jgi:hypothetical protein
MYFAAIVLLMLVLPVASIAAEAPLYQGAGGLVSLIGKWFTFWTVGVRLFTAGVMQIIRPTRHFRRRGLQQASRRCRALTQPRWKPNEQSYLRDHSSRGRMGLQRPRHHLRDIPEP